VFAGCTERKILNNVSSIVKTALPVEKVAQHFMECKNTSKTVILDYITFVEERKKVL